MTRILFVAINARYVHSNPAVLYLKKIISDLNYESEVAGFSINESKEKILSHITAVRPDIVAISVYIWNAEMVSSLLHEIKEKIPGVKIVCGGPEVSYNADEWLISHPEIDYIIKGGGEAGFRELALSGFESPERIISIRNLPFSDIPFPYDDAEMKSLSGKFIYYESSRGCPFKCSYCLSSRSDQALDFRNIDMVRSELDFFRHHNPRLVKFVDRTFNCRKDHYMAVWKHIVDKFSVSDTCFHFEIFPDLLDDEDLAFLSTVPRGLFQFEMGIQSLKSETLSAINRGGRRDGWLEKIKSIAAMGNIHLHVDLIAGLPYESYADFSESFNTVHAVGAEHFQCGFLKVLPGTEMHEKSYEYGLEYSPLPPYMVSKSRWIDHHEMERLHEIEELLEIYYNSGRFRETEKFLTGFAGSPFRFYENLSGFYKENIRFNLREWPGAAELLIEFSSSSGLAADVLIRDYLRWDWCSSMKMHHYPDLLKSDYTLETKRKAYNYIIRFSEKGEISFKGFEFKADDLRRSIFFRAESREFRGGKLNSAYALFLPDKSIICFDIE